MNTKLYNYLFSGLDSSNCPKKVGLEVETHFFNNRNEPLDLSQSQAILIACSKNGWRVAAKKNGLVVELIRKKCGTVLIYELGRQNLEVCLPPLLPASALELVHEVLNELYEVAAEFNCQPNLVPVIESKETLLVIPDNRDSLWLKLDTAPILNELAKTASVQFTIDVSSGEAISIVNKLNKNIDLFLSDYPQEKFWRNYIKNSPAGYLYDRYGGPTFFRDKNDYCDQLTKHKVVTDGGLIDITALDRINFRSFLRSIWWYFRLKRYGQKLCIEIRPLARRNDELINVYWQKISSLINY